MARTTTRRPQRAAGSKTARRPRKTPLRSTTPQRKRTPSRNSFQHRPDLIGASLIALGMFLGFVEYMGWDGGVIGAKIDGALHLMAGRVAAAAPLLLVVAGASIFLRSRVHQVRPLRTGVALLVFGAMLAFSSTDTATAESHGGLLGSYARSLLQGLVGPVGVTILVAMCMVTAIVLITGGSIGLAMRSSGQRVAAAAGAGARLSEEMVRMYRERPAHGRRCVRFPASRRGPEAQAAAMVRVPLPTSSPTSPADEPGRRACPSPNPRLLRSRHRCPSTCPRPKPRPSPSQQRTTSRPRSACRSPLTERRIACPTRPSFGSPRRRDAKVDHAPVARKLVEALANFGVEARLVGMVNGPRVTRFELQLAPGTKVSRVSRASR